MTLLDYFSGGFAAAAIGEAGSRSPCMSLASNTDMSREQLREALLHQAVSQAGRSLAVFKILVALNETM